MCELYADGSALTSDAVAICLYAERAVKIYI